jgi:hypothetical protein
MGPIAEKDEDQAMLGLRANDSIASGLRAGDCPDRICHSPTLLFPRNFSAVIDAQVRVYYMQSRRSIRRDAAEKYFLGLKCSLSERAWRANFGYFYWVGSGERLAIRGFCKGKKHASNMQSGRKTV